MSPKVRVNAEDIHGRQKEETYDVEKIVEHHENQHGETVFSLIGEMLPGYFIWALESEMEVLG